MCGIFGIRGSPDAAALTALGLHALQHRGQDAAGIVSFDKSSRFHIERRMGLVGDNFTKPSVMERLVGDRAIGHTRYRTEGGLDMRDVQPLFAEFAGGGFALAHNGDLTNAKMLRKRLQKEGAIFSSTSDTEIVIHLIARSQGGRLIGRFIDALSRVEGAYALVALSEKKLIGCRDPRGIRPLLLGDLKGMPVLASETCAFDIVGARTVRDIEPGEMVVITEGGMESHKPFPMMRRRSCIFEHVYFSRPDSVVSGLSVSEARERIGAELAEEAPVKADIVVPVPDSGNPAAIGFARAAGLPFDLGIIRNHYVGRTFIEPTDVERHFGVRLKHNANAAVLRGKRVVLVDDSIVRGTTAPKIVQLVREAGATEVHMRIASPPTTDPCFYGVNTPKKSGLLAARMSVEEMRRFVGANSLRFVSHAGLYRAVGEPDHVKDYPYCDACFSGRYPTAVPR